MVVTAAPAGRWSDFWTRLASTAILGPLALLALWFGGLAWAMLIGVTMAGMGWEWARLGRQPAASYLPALPAVAWLVTLLFGVPAGALALLVLAIAVWVKSGRFAAAGLPYIGIGGLTLLWLRDAPAQGLNATLFLVTVVWATDIGAYLVGRVVGGSRMAPRISPGKTWSGAIGGLVFGAVAGWLAAGGNWAALPVALLLSLAAQSGDLLESAIKRKLGVKDSGRTIPGHGGLFDRLDGFLAAAPVAVILAVSMHHGIMPVTQGVMP
jgi:phosphatidate cytidylyltransferase